MSASHNIQPKRLFHIQVWLILLVALVGLLFLWNLEGYPSPWFDEGLNLQPPKDLILYGKYALLSSEGFRVLDSALQTGPPVLLPVALSFELLGIGLIQARLVTSLFSILCVAVYYRVAQSLYNQTIAWLAVVLLLTFGAANDFVSFLYMGRQVIGETTALLFFLGGLLLWFSSWERVEARYLVGAGLLFGLAMVTKSQFNLLAPPTILVVWLIGFFAFKVLRWRYLVPRQGNYDIPRPRPMALNLVHQKHFDGALVLPMILCAGLVLVWYSCQVMILGPQQFLLNAAQLRAGMQLHVLDFLSPVKVRTAAGVLVRTGYVVWGGLSLIYALGRSRQCDPVTLRRLALLVFVGLWLAWYTLASIGWARYAFIALATSHVFYAALLRDTFAALTRLQQASLRRRGPQIVVALVLWLVAGWMVISGASVMRQVLWDSNESYFQFARYLNERIPAGASVESWEWGLDLVTNVCYHHPPAEVTNAVTRRLWVDGSKSDVVYDVRQFAPEYVVVGSFARWIGLYTDVGLLEKASLQASIGEYALYHINW